MRLDKFICECTGKSRAEVKPIIRGGGVSVNGAVCKAAQTHVAQGDDVCLYGKPLTHTQFVYIMLNKPKDVVCASKDAHDTCAIDLVKHAYPRRNLFCAGRLDKTSTGFVLITDDGNFAHDILSPKKHVEKTYLVQLDAPATQKIQDEFLQGVTLANKQTMKPASLEISEDAFCVTVTITQGVYHQIKKMFGVFGIGVNELRRIKIGGVKLDKSLDLGHYRELTKSEIETIMHKIPN